MVKVGPADRLLLAVESPTTPQHVGCLVTFAPTGSTDLRRLASDMRAVTAIASPFNQRLRRPRLKWIVPSWVTLADDQVDLDYHFRHSALPRPGGERELGVLVSRLHSRPLDPGRPLWEMHLIEGLADERFALYFKVHHALMDGAGGIQRFRQMISMDVADTAVRPLWSIGPRPPVGGRRLGVIRRVRAGARTIGGLGSAGVQMIRDARDPDELERAIPFVAPKSVINGTIGRQRRVATQSYDFDRLKAIAAASDTTINDVFLCVVGGGLRRYLAEIGELPARGLTAGTPVNVRDVDDETSTNAFTMTVMNLGTDIADPVERLGLISRSSTLAKQRLRQLPGSVASLYAGLFMGPFIGQNLVGLGGKVRPPFNVAVSNIPGPVEPLYFAGARLEAMYPLACLYHGVALFIAVLAAGGRFSVGFCGDRDSLPHLQKLAVYTGEALDELATALAVTG